MSDVKVSIIIPVFNPDTHLIKCLDSIINQTMKEIEIICVDDGSTDGSLNILKDYAKKDLRFKILKQKNSGAGVARNNGIEHSNGEYLLFIDSDDWIEEDTCEKLYAQANKLNSDLIIFDSIWHLEKNHHIKSTYFENNKFKEDYKNFTFDYKYIQPQIMNAGLGVIWSKFYKSSFIKDNNIEFPPHKIYNDIEFHFKTVLLAKRISFYPKTFYHYIKLGQPSLQTSFRSGEDDLLWFDVLIGLRKFLTNFDFFNLKVEFLEYFIFYSIIKMRSINDKFEPVLFDKLKLFFETLPVTSNELDEIKFSYFTFYIHIITSKTFEEYKIKQENFDGNIT